MTKVYLHGLLGEKFGEVWDLEISKPIEAISAIVSQAIMVLFASLLTNVELMKVGRDPQRRDQIGFSGCIRQFSRTHPTNLVEPTQATKDKQVFRCKTGSS